MRARHQAQVHWSDPDMLGHLNHARYLTMFEDARMAMLASSPAGYAGAPGGRGFIAARVAVDYLSAVTYRPGLLLDIDTWVGKIGTSSWTLLAELRDGGTPRARCECVLVGYDYDTARSRPLEPDERGYLGRYLES